MSGPPIRLMLVDGHAAFVRPLKFLLDREPDLDVVAHAGTLFTARQHLATGIVVDVALVDLDLPDGSGLDLIHDLTVASREAYAVVLTGAVDDRMRALAVAAGASAVFSKRSDIAEVIDAVRRLCAGESVIPPLEAIALLRQAGRLLAQERSARAAMESLTPREHEVLLALADGLADKEIAVRLGIGERTVRVHMVNLLHKLGANSRLQAVILAARLGVVRIG